VGLSRSYFSRQFKATFGLGFEEYLRRKRVERSEHLLRYSSLSIKQIADACGFASAAHFDRVFRRAGSETPSAYRAKFRKVR
jgi:AraC-like DNA-binding protein